MNKKLLVLIAMMLASVSAVKTVKVQDQDVDEESTSLDLDEEVLGSSVSLSEDEAFDTIEVEDLLFDVGEDLQYEYEDTSSESEDGARHYLRANNRGRSWSSSKEHDANLLTPCEMDNIRVEPSPSASGPDRKLQGSTDDGIPWGPSKNRTLAVFGKDDRYTCDISKSAHSAVGRVTTDKGNNRYGICTGTMVGPRLMLTAQHCLNRLSNGGLGQMKFTPAYYDGHAPYGSAYAKHVWWQKTIPNRNTLYEYEFAWDYVVVLLDRRIGDKVGWWGFKQYQASWNDHSYWENIGYGAEIYNGQRPLCHPKAPIHSVQAYSSGGTTSYFMKHAIDTTRGHSGGPVYGIFDGNEIYVVGVNVSGGGGASGGPGLLSLISQLRQQYG